MKCRHFTIKRLKFPMVMTDPNYSVMGAGGYMNVQHGKCIKYSTKLH